MCFGSSGLRGFIKFWSGFKFLRNRMYMHKLQFNFLDFWKYSCILKMNFPKKKHIKILVKSSRVVSSINFENRLISCIFWFPFCHASCLCTDDKISYASLLFCSLCSEVDIYETGLVRSRSITKKTIKQIKETPTMEFKNLFDRKLLVGHH